MNKINIQFIGYGAMGSSIGEILCIKEGVNMNINIITRNSREGIMENLGSKGLLERDDISFKYGIDVMSDIVFLCVKPQQVNEIDHEFYKKTCLCISVMNGISTDKLSHFDSVIRTMPNLFGSVGSGITGWFEKGYIQEYMRTFSENIFTESGIVIKLGKELDFAGFTAFAGCGPAIVAYIESKCDDDIYRSFIYENLVRTGNRLGLSIEQSTLIVQKLREGLPKYLSKYGINNQDLIQRVSSKGGSTEAIISSFERECFYEEIKRQSDNIEETLYRSIILGKERAEEIELEYSR